MRGDDQTEPNNSGSNDKRLRATQPNDPNAAFACGGGNGTNRVFESSMHDDSFTRKRCNNNSA